MNTDAAEAQPESLPAIAVHFLHGGLVTAAFSGSLDVPAVHAELPEVLAVGMIVPCFTWVVQTAAARALLDARRRQLYWGDLGRACVWGSYALLPAAAVNLLTSQPPLWVSAANVLASVALMTAYLARVAPRHGLSRLWPFSFLCTISVNMGLFVLSSRAWW